MNECRSEVTFTVNRLCKYMSNPGHVYFQAVVWFIRYLSGTRNWVVRYTRKGIKIIIGNADTDFSVEESRYSIFSYISMLANAPISWRVGSQDMIALSTCKSEVRTIHAMKEAARPSGFVPIRSRSKGFNIECLTGLRLYFIQASL